MDSKNVTIVQPSKLDSSEMDSQSPHTQLTMMYHF